MKRFITQLFALTLVLAMCLSLVACSGSDSTPKSDSSSVRVGSMAVNFIESLDPVGWNTDFSYTVGYLCYDHLFYVDPEEGAMTSDVLSNWHWSDDSKTLYMTLRDDVYFSNGDQMTGDDVLYSIALQLEIPYFSSWYSAIDIDSSTVNGQEIELRYFYPYGPGLDAFMNCAIVNKDYWESLGSLNDIDWFDPSSICGSGAYELTDFVTSTSMTFKLRDDWWYAEEAPDGYCSVDEITCIKYADATTMMVDYETGAIDVALGITKNDVERFESSEIPGACKTIPSNDVWLCALATETCDLLQNEKIREAICYAVDTETITNTVFGRLGIVPTSSLASTAKYYVPGHAYEYDIEHAKQCVAESGIPADELVLNVLADAGTVTDIFQIMQNNLAEIGITLNIETYDEAAIFPMLMEGLTDLQIRANTSGAPTGEVCMAYSAFQEDSIMAAMRKTFENSPEIAALLADGLQTTDDAARSEIYANVQGYFYDNFEVLPLTEWLDAFCYNTEKISSMNLYNCFEADLRFIAPVG